MVEGRSRRAAPDGVLAVTDRRYLNSLRAHGWAERREVRRSPRSRRTKTVHVITEAGREALNMLPVDQPQPRPDWRGWARERLSEGRYLVCGHELYRPARGMLWRLLCQDHPADQPVAEVETLAEVLDVLATHLWREGCARTGPTGPRGHHPVDNSGIVSHDPETEDIVDLDVVDLEAAEPDVAELTGAGRRVGVACSPLWAKKETSATRRGRSGR